MPEMNIRIGVHTFCVSYQKGEKKYLKEAAEILEDAAQELGDFVHLSSKRTLLMAGLLLADKFNGVTELVESFSKNRLNMEGNSSSSDIPYGVDKRNVKDIKLWAKVDDPNAPAAERRSAFDKILEREAQRKQEIPALE